jgi:hypothetical protein
MHERGLRLVDKGIYRNAHRMHNRRMELRNCNIGITENKS